MFPSHSSIARRAQTSAHCSSSSSFSSSSSSRIARCACGRYLSAVENRRGTVSLRRSSGAEESKVALSDDDDDDDDDNDDFLQFLEDSMEVAAGEKKDDDWIGEPGSAMRGEELRKLVLKRYGKLYDTRICQRRDSMNKLQLFLQIMWKFVGQKSFPMTEAEYIEQTDAVAEILTMKNRQDLVRANLPIWPKWPKMDTTGANAVMIPLDIDEEDLTIDGE
mmetsp:Transcript_3775/g.11613  ORF Transcript_3775/g.11613 Transcript_3775/m.11613 type:complete len:220 (-) Transcript_3775:72-731(-)